MPALVGPMRHTQRRAATPASAVPWRRSNAAHCFRVTSPVSTAAGVTSPLAAASTGRPSPHCTAAHPCRQVIRQCPTRLGSGRSPATRRTIRVCRRALTTGRDGPSFAISQGSAGRAGSRPELLARAGVPQPMKTRMCVGPCPDRPRPPADTGCGPRPGGLSAGAACALAGGSRPHWPPPRGGRGGRRGLFAPLGACHLRRPRRRSDQSQCAPRRSTPERPRRGNAALRRPSTPPRYPLGTVSARAGSASGAPARTAEASVERSSIVSLGADTAFAGPLAASCASPETRAV